MFINLQLPCLPYILKSTHIIVIDDETPPQLILRWWGKARYVELNDATNACERENRPDRQAVAHIVVYCG